MNFGLRGKPPGKREPNLPSPFWQWAEQALRLYEYSISPKRWLETEAWIALRFSLLLTITILSPVARDTLWIYPFLFLTLLAIADILLAHTTIAFVTRSPALPLRSALLAFFAWIQVGIGFGTFLVWQGKSFTPSIETASQAIYLSFVTMATLGYGDIIPNKSEPLALWLVIVELLVGLYFVAIIIAIIASWANRESRIEGHMEKRLLKAFGVPMEPDFPGSEYEAVYSLVEKKQQTSEVIWEQYRDAWKALAYHFLSCASHDEAFTASVTKHGNGPPQPERLNQEHHLFGFFYTGLAAVEALHYGLFAMGALSKTTEFPMATPKNMRDVTPKSTFDAFSTSFPREELTLALGALKDDQEWKNWKETRDILSHRMIPGRTFHLSNVNSDPGEALWLKGIAIDNTTTSSRRQWLSRHLSQILKSACTFAKHHF